MSAFHRIIYFLFFFASDKIVPCFVLKISNNFSRDMCGRIPWGRNNSYCFLHANMLSSNLLEQVSQTTDVNCSGKDKNNLLFVYKTSLLLITLLRYVTVIIASFRKTCLDEDFHQCNALYPTESHF